MKAFVFLASFAVILSNCAKKKPPVAVTSDPIPDQTPLPVVKILDFEKMEKEPEPERIIPHDLPVIYFDYDKSNLREDQLHKMGVMLSLIADGKCRIEGHACEIGTELYNMALGEQRAATVMQWLVAAQVNPGELRLISYGEERPATADSERLELNRRVEVKCR